MKPSLFYKISKYMLKSFNFYNELLINLVHLILKSNNIIQKHLIKIKNLYLLNTLNTIIF